jgi:hypothetical protein
MKDKYEKYGNILWQSLTSVPFGSLSKRELEILLLHSAISSNLIHDHPVNIASILKLTLSKTNGYLTDISLRNPNLDDKVAILEILTLLPSNEILTEDSHFTIPINNASLRIWLERKIVLVGLNPGESLRKDLIKITPAGLCRILDNSDGILSPKEAINLLAEKFINEIWFLEAKNNWKSETKWRDVLSTSTDIISLATFFSTIIPLSIKSII